MKKHITLIAAARPNFIKIAPIAHALEKDPHFSYTLVHTGQHFDKQMSDTFFKQLNIPEPNINLNVGGGSHAYQTGMVMIKFEEYLQKNPTDLVIVVGDVNATVACCITAKKCHIPVAHIEAGLRSFDQNMPEEINRILTDSISDILYTPSPDGDIQLLKEGIDPSRIAFVGNIMIDTLVANQSKAKQVSTDNILDSPNQPYAILTLHRPSNVDHKETFSSIITALETIAKDMPIIWPIHPRSKKNIEQFNFSSKINKSIQCINPLGYHEMLNLVTNAHLTLTDSGGLQEETTFLGVPCITIRENTERPITITEGTNQLAGTTTEGILSAYQNIQKQKTKNCPKYWDGQTTSRIINHLKKNFFNI